MATDLGALSLVGGGTEGELPESAQREPARPRRVLSFDHTPSPQEIAARLAQEGDVAEAIVLLAVCQVARERGAATIEVTADDILDKIEALGMLPDWDAAHGRDREEVNG